MKLKKDSIYCRYIKRLLDITCSILALILFSWLYLFVAVLVKVKLGSPVLFKQSRPGKNGIEFTMFKFRTMTDQGDDEGKLLPDEKRLTRFGRLLRASSLDELPEAINILKGDMSIIGPRPLLVEYLPYYTEKESHRHDVRPGLSGWAQVNGRNTVTWEDKLSHDIDYVEHVTFLFDCKILWMTIVKTIKRADVLMGNQLRVGRLDVERGKAINVQKG